MIRSLPSIMHGSIKTDLRIFQIFFTTCSDLSMSKVGQMSDDQHFIRNLEILFGPEKNHSEFPAQIGIIHIGSDKVRTSKQVVGFLTNPRTMQNIIVYTNITIIIKHITFCIFLIQHCDNVRCTQSICTFILKLFPIGFNQC